MYGLVMPMDFEVATIGERGQVVIPRLFRDDMAIHKGDKFMVLQRGDMLVFKKLRGPTADDFDKMLKKAHTHAKEHGLVENDLNAAVRKARRK